MKLIVCMQMIFIDYAILSGKKRPDISARPFLCCMNALDHLYHAANVHDMRLINVNGSVWSQWDAKPYP